MKNTRFVFALGISLAAAACGSSPEPQPAADDPTPEPPGPVPELSWRASHDWVRRGFGEVYRLEATDLDGDGVEELLVAARRPLVLDGMDMTPRWSFDWQPEAHDPLYRASDLATASVMIPVGGEDVIVVDDRERTWRLAGADGTQVWKRELDTRFGFTSELTSFGDPAARLFFPRYGYAAYDPRTGEEAWRSPLPTWPSYLAEAARGAGEPTGLFAAHQRDSIHEQRGVSARAIGNHDGEHGPDRPGLHGIAPDGALLFSREFATDVQIVALAAADLDASGHDGAVLGFDDGTLLAVDPAGETIWEQTFAPFASDPQRTVLLALEPVDLDGDGADEILALATDGRFLVQPVGPHVLLALDADGSELWRYSFTQRTWTSSVQQLGGDPVFVIGTGPSAGATTGQVFLVDLHADAARRATVLDVPRRADAVEIRRGAEGEEIVVGSWDGMLRAFGPSGAQQWERYLTGHVVDLAAIGDVNATEGVAFADETATVAFVDPEGALAWYRRMDVGEIGLTMGLATGPLGADGAASVVAIAYGMHQAGPGVVEAYGAAGNLRFALHTQGIPLAVRVGRYAGGAQVAVVESMRSERDTCRLVFFDAGGTRVRETELLPCGGAFLASGDVDGDGSDELGVWLAKAEAFQPSYVLLTGSDGEVRWTIDEIDTHTYWIELVPGGLLHGGVTTGVRGFTMRRDAATGQRAWLSLFDPRPDLAQPDGQPLGADVADVAIVPDRDGDGVDELALSTLCNDLYLLDGATGEVRWNLLTESSEVQTFRANGGALAWVPEADARPAYLVHAKRGSSLNHRSAIQIVSAEGELEAEVPTASPSTGAVTVMGWSGGPKSVVAGPFSLYATGVEVTEEGAAE